MKFTVTLNHEQLRQQAHMLRLLLIDTPCPGLQSVDDPRILSYLQRTSIPGGGSKPRHVLCKNLFGEEIRLSDLTPKQMNKLRRVEQLDYLWINVHSTLSVHSSSCLKVLRLTEAQLEKGSWPCSSCRDLLALKTFRNTISRPIPDPANVKFTPHAMTVPMVQDIVKRQLGVENLFTSVCLIYLSLSTELTTYKGQQGGYWLRFAQEAARGDFDAHTTFLDLIQYFVERTRLAAGKTTRGLVTPPSYHQLCNAVSLVSNSAYKLLRGTLGGPEVRTLR